MKIRAVSRRALACFSFAMTTMVARAETPPPPIDVFQLASIESLFSTGEWRASERGWRTTAGHRSRIALPLAPSASFELRTTFRIESGYNFAIALPLAPGMALMWVTARHKGGNDGVYLDGFKQPASYAVLRPPTFRIGNDPIELTVRFDRSNRDDVRITADLNDECVMAWSGSRRDLSLRAEYALPTETLGLANWWTTVDFETVQLVMPPSPHRIPIDFETRSNDESAVNSRTEPAPRRRPFAMRRDVAERLRALESLFDGALRTTAVAPLDSDELRTIFEDDTVEFAISGHGPRRRARAPRLFIRSKKHSVWLRIDQVSVRGAKFGRSPTLDELRAAGTSVPPPIGWDDSFFATLPSRRFHVLPGSVSVGSGRNRARSGQRELAPSVPNELERSGDCHRAQDPARGARARTPKSGSPSVERALRALTNGGGPSIVLPIRRKRVDRKRWHEGSVRFNMMAS